MKTSPNGLDLIKAFENCMKTIPAKPGFFMPYFDAADVLTIGWGHTNDLKPFFTKDDVWSADDCSNALVSDLTVFEQHVMDLAKVDLAQNEFDALVSWSFNTGGPETATLWKKLNIGDKAAIPAELAKWNRAGGRVLAGLVRRRKAEGTMFVGDVTGALKLAHS